MACVYSGSVSSSTPSRSKITCRTGRGSMGLPTIFASLRRVEAEERGGVAPHRLELIDELVPGIEEAQAHARVLRGPPLDRCRSHRFVLPAHEGESGDANRRRR